MHYQTKSVAVAGRMGGRIGSNRKHSSHKSNVSVRGQEIILSKGAPLPNLKPGSGVGIFPLLNGPFLRAP
jgi:hypothetical protein